MTLSRFIARELMKNAKSEYDAENHRSFSLHFIRFLHIFFPFFIVVSSFGSSSVFSRHKNWIDKTTGGRERQHTTAITRKTTVTQIVCLAKRNKTRKIPRKAFSINRSAEEDSVNWESIFMLTILRCALWERFLVVCCCCSVVSTIVKTNTINFHFSLSRISCFCFAPLLPAIGGGWCSPFCIEIAKRLYIFLLSTLFMFFHNFIRLCNSFSAR